MSLKSLRARKPFRIVSRRSAFRGRRVDLDLLQIVTEGGKRVERELVKHRGAAIVIPRRPDGRLILVRQLRIATGGKIWEFPAGTLERGESSARCARRELEEETGWRPGRLRKLVRFYPTPGISTEQMELFLADHLRKVSHGPGDGEEELEILDFSPRELERMIRRGRILDGKTILGFLWLQRYLKK